MDETTPDTNGPLSEAPVADPAPAALAASVPVGKRTLEPLSFDALWKACEPKPIWVDLPILGGKVQLRGMTRDEQTEMREAATIRGKVDDPTLESMFIARCMIAPPVTVDQASAMRKKLAGHVQVLLNAVLDASGLTVAAQEAAGADFRPGE